tara:strand:+ start:3296 stop:3412 length:117 start_codon:yes stop_codon:yes gene_type:complete
MNKKTVIGYELVLEFSCLKESFIAVDVLLARFLESIEN